MALSQSSWALGGRIGGKTLDLVAGALRLTYLTGVFDNPSTLSLQTIN